MSRVRERAPSAGMGWFVTFGGAAILLAFGFGIGLVAGSALEEPELVAKHLAGEATELPLPEAAPATASSPRAAERAPVAPAPDRAAPPATGAPPAPGSDRAVEAADPEPAASTPAAAKPPAAPTPKPVAPPRAPAPAPVAVAARPTGFAIQVGAFADRKAADELVASLRGDRLRAYVVEGARTESARFRVRVGPYPTRDQAGDEAARLKAKRRLPTWVIAEGGT